jgi:Ca2+-transporting ATPase
LSLEEGDKIPADSRLIEEIALEIEEASLTGESVPVIKETDPITDPKTAIADQNNMVFMGTIVTRGKGLAVVVATGMDTEIGKIASGITEEGPTPLQRKLDILGKQISMMAILAVIILIVIDQLIPPRDLFQSFLLAVSLAVAIIPEGLPIVMLVTLAMGMQIMARKNAIIRKLPAVEALGSTTVICTDKTGTLTRNQMTVREMWLGGRTYNVKGGGYRPEGEILQDGRAIDISSPVLQQAIRTMSRRKTAGPSWVTLQKVHSS